MADYAGRAYEYIGKNTLKPVKEKVDKIIRELQGKLRKEGITFEPKIIGSGSRNLVTRVKRGNTGFDFDYNFSLQKAGGLSEKDLKLLVISKLEEVIKNTKYISVSNGKTSMKIKVINSKKSKIVHSCDFAIVNDYESDNRDLCQEILVRDKTSDRYFWNEKPKRKNYIMKIENIKSNGLWGELREEYLKLKDNNHDSKKKSFNLFYEGLNNVYNRYDWS